VSLALQAYNIIVAPGVTVHLTNLAAGVQIAQGMIGKSFIVSVPKLCSVHFAAQDSALGYEFVRVLAGQIPFDWFAKLLRFLVTDTWEFNKQMHLISACIGTGI